MQLYNTRRDTAVLDLAINRPTIHSIRIAALRYESAPALTDWPSSGSSVLGGEQFEDQHPPHLEDKIIAIRHQKRAQCLGSLGRPYVLHQLLDGESNDRLFWFTKVLRDLFGDPRPHLLLQYLIRVIVNRLRYVPIA